MTARLAMRTGAVLLLFLADVPAHAGLCMPPIVQKESPYHYIVSLAAALGYAKDGLSRTTPPALKQDATGFNLLLALRLGKADFECAESQVLPYAKSSNEAIHGSADGAAMTFTLLADLHRKSAAQEAALIDSIADGMLKPGSFTERQAELAASYNEVWNGLISDVILGTYSVLELDSTTGRMSRLSLTRLQRDEILAKLRSIFGEEVTTGMKAGQIPLVAAASALYQVVGDPKRRSRGDK